MECLSVGIDVSKRELVIAVHPTGDQWTTATTPAGIATVVKRLQTLLRERGLFPEPAKIDGDFGEITEAAVKALQELNDLNPDGKVGPLTWRALQASDVKVPAGGKVLQPA